MHPTPLDYQGLHLFRPPYRECTPINMNSQPGEAMPGHASVWFMTPDSQVHDELRWAALRPRSLPLFIVLPPPSQVAAMTHALRELPRLRPKGVLPGIGRDTLPALRTLLAAPPLGLPRAVVDQLEGMGVIPDPEARARIELIFAAAPHTTSIQALARRLCQSRRTVGRFFSARDLPVPSHWLQFARILHVAIQIQNTHLNIGRVAVRFGYPDGFTMSNTMKRLTGYRPSFVRAHLGWEWILEAWWREERRG